jgi:hypothetical protein
MYINKIPNLIDIHLKKYIFPNHQKVETRDGEKEIEIL